MARRVIPVVALMIWVLSACNLTAPDPTPIPAPDVPVARFEFPVNGARILEGTEVVLDIVAMDSVQGIARVELYIDSVFVREFEPPDGVVEVFRLTTPWVAQGLGFHTLSVVPYRPDNTPGLDRVISVEVIAPE